MSLQQGSSTEPEPPHNSPADAASTPPAIESGIEACLLANRRKENDPKLVFDQYKLYVELTDRLSARRHQANQFFVGVNSGLCAIIGYVAKTAPELSIVTWTVPFVGILLSYLWSVRLRSYGQLIAAKFEVINAFERHLPMAPYSAEWIAISAERGGKPYYPFSRQEIWIPRVFVALYAVLTLFMAIGIMG